MGSAVLKSIVCAAAVALVLSTSLRAAPAQISVIPAPAHVDFRRGTEFHLDARTKIYARGGPGALRVANYFCDLMRQTQDLTLSVTRSPTPALPMRTSPTRPVNSIVFELTPRSATASPEGYEIDVSARSVTVSAGNPRGLLYGAGSLWQLYSAAASDSAPGNIPAVKIADFPRFPWRGLMLDSARHFQSPEFILRFIDWMALHRLNVLHWHLTDDQAWRLEIKKYPRLTSVGAWRVPAGAGPAADIDPTTGHPRLYGGFYSQDTVRRIVAHAAERNITIVPEIDLPGHATAAVVAYPRLASVVPAPAVVPSDWGVYSNLFNADEATFKFLEDVLTEVVQLFPGKYVHIGGDEAVKDQWKASPQIQSRIRELGVSDETALQAYFVERMGRFLDARGRLLIGWDEVLEGKIPADATVMSWRGVDGAFTAAKAGHDAVLSPSPTLYFDNRQSPVDTQPGRAHVVGVEDIYRFDPMPPSLPADQRHHILGLQANIFTEHIRSEPRVEYMTFPRAAAVAEVGWSPAEQLDWNGFLARLPEEMNRYRSLGIHAAPAPNPMTAALPGARRTSFELKSCTDKVVIGLEDDAPVNGDRAVFEVDILNPCWIFRAADLSHGPSMQAAVGQVPFNFQIGKDIHAIRFNRPQTPSGELEVRLDACDGERLALLPLQTAIGNDAVTVLPRAMLTRHAGTHDLCLKFTQWSVDPLWVIDWVELE